MCYPKFCKYCRCPSDPGEIQADARPVIAFPPSGRLRRCHRVADKLVASKACDGCRKKAYESLDPDVRGAISFADLLDNPSRLGDIVVRLANKRPAAVNTPEGGNANA